MDCMCIDIHVLYFNSWYVGSTDKMLGVENMFLFEAGDWTGCMIYTVLCLLNPQIAPIHTVAMRCLLHSSWPGPMGVGMAGVFSIALMAGPIILPRLAQPPVLFVLGV